jgi:hypothetical protein
LPIAQFGFSTAQTILGLISYSCFIALILEGAKALVSLKDGRAFACVFAASCFAAYPMAEVLKVGQTDLILSLAVFMSWQWTKRHRNEWPAAAFIATAIMFKPHFALLLLPLMAAGGWRAGRRVLVCCAVYLLASLVVLPASWWGDWIRLVVLKSGYGRQTLSFHPALCWNQSFNGFAARLFLPSEHAGAGLDSQTLARLLPTCFAVSVIAFLAWCSLRLFRAGMNRAVACDLMFPLCLVTVYLVSPFSWEAHLSFVLPALLIVLFQEAAAGISRVRFLAIAGSASILIWSWPYNDRSLLAFPLSVFISLKFFAVFVCYTCLVHRTIVALRAASSSVAPGTVSTA